MSIMPPRVVMVRRETELDRVRATHPSLATARFVLEQRGLSLGAVEDAHRDFAEVIRRVRAAVPPDWASWASAWWLEAACWARWKSGS